MIGLSVVALLIIGAWGLIRCLMIKRELEDTLKDANISGIEFYSSAPLQITLYRNAKLNKISPKGEAIIKKYINAEISLIAASSLIVILLAMTK